MSNIDVKWVTDKVTGEPIFPITHIDAVRDDDGNPLSDYLNNEEVEIGDTTPTGDPKIFVDESADPSDSDLLDFYTQEEVDAKIATAPEQNTINSTDFVVLKDEDNVNRKISKANIMGVVKDALAELLLNNDLGTNFSNVPALGANAFGSATLANLASALSVIGLSVNHIGCYSNHPLDGDFSGLYGTMSDNSLYYCQISSPNTYGDSFFSSFGCGVGDSFIVMRYDANSGCVLVFNRTNEKVGVRFNVFGWQGWKTL